MTHTQIDVTFSFAELTRWPDTIEDTRRLLSHVENALSLLARIQEDGDHDGHHGLGAMAHLCARAVAGCQIAQDQELERLAARLRDGRADWLKGGAA